MVWSLFIIDDMGLFFYNKIGSIISIGDLPTTNIIEPEKLISRKGKFRPFFFLMFRAMIIRFLKFLKFRKPKSLRLISLMGLLVTSSLALE